MFFSITRVLKELETIIFLGRQFASEELVRKILEKPKTVSHNFLLLIILEV